MISFWKQDTENKQKKIRNNYEQLYKFSHTTWIDSYQLQLQSHILRVKDNNGTGSPTCALSAARLTRESCAVPSSRAGNGPKAVVMRRTNSWSVAKKHQRVHQLLTNKTEGIYN